MSDAKSTPHGEPDPGWAEAWLDSVANSSATMSQRSLTSIEKRGGGLDAVAEVARRKRVHLLLLEDDQGKELVAASTRPFRVIT